MLGYDFRAFLDNQIQILLLKVQWVEIKEVKKKW
jgi:hypothetical protein